MTRRIYTTEQKAAALARVLAGESVSVVADELNITRTALQNWVAEEQSRSVIAVMTTPRARTREEERNEQLRDDMAAVMHATMGAIARQAEQYGSDTFITSQPPAILFEATRTLWRSLFSALDRYSGGGEESPVSDDHD